MWIYSVTMHQCGKKKTNRSKGLNLPYSEIVQIELYKYYEITNLKWALIGVFFLFVNKRWLICFRNSQQSPCHPWPIVHETLPFKHLHNSGYFKLKQMLQTNQVELITLVLVECQNIKIMAELERIIFWISNILSLWIKRSQDYYNKGLLCVNIGNKSYFMQW